MPTISQFRSAVEERENANMNEYKPSSSSALSVYISHASNLARG
jgi:hypothetical protein